MNDKKIKLLIREGEGLTVEFKQKYSSRIDEDIVAFANTKGGALLLGVRDDGTVAGERLTNDLKARVNSLARNCKPSIPVSMMQVNKIVAIDVPEGTEKPYSCGSGYYRRLNGTTQKMSHDELRVMFSENEAFPFEEKTVKDFVVEDISRIKIRAFTKEAGISIGDISVPEFLRSLDVADEKRVKNVGILFFAKDVGRCLPQAQMTLVAFKGTKKLHIYDRQDVRDDLLTQFNAAMSFLQKHINVRSEIHGVNREDIYEIPLEALREAVVNALMHRDYSVTGTQINVEIYDDRVEIINPGGLPKGLPLAKFGKVSIRRNEIIADLFYRMHKVERLGMGIQKMREAMTKAGLQMPVFEPNGFFRAVFYRSPEFALKEAGRQPESRPESQPEWRPESQPESLDRRVLALLRSQALGKSEISALLGQKEVSGQLNKVIRALMGRGLIEYTLPDKPRSRLQKYRLTEKGKKELEKAK